MKLFCDLWKDWNERRVRLAEFDCADRAEMVRVSADLGTSVEELRSLVGRGTKAADLLARRMHSLNLNPSGVEPAVMRDLQRCCANCSSKTLCAHELEDRPKEARWPKYCPNELTISALRTDIQGSQT
jgi:hypothetical protein